MLAKEKRLARQKQTEMRQAQAEIQRKIIEEAAYVIKLILNFNLWINFFSKERKDKNKSAFQNSVWCHSFFVFLVFFFNLMLGSDRR